MIIAIDFDNTLVEQHSRDYADVTSPFVMMPGAFDALVALKRARHQIIVWSGRSSLALRKNPRVDPLARVGKKQIDMLRWKASQQVNESRYLHMLEFCSTDLQGLVDAVDDGTCGKLTADMFIDDRAIRLGKGSNAWLWPEVERLYGLPTEAA